MSDIPTGADIFPASATAYGQHIGDEAAGRIRAKQADPLMVLRALPESPEPEALELALREFAELAGPEPLRRATLRGAAIETLKAQKVCGPAAVVDAALGTTAVQPDPGSGAALNLPEPEPWPVAVDGAQLFADLAAVVRRHVICSAEQADAVALWVVFTHAIGGARIAPKLAVTSPTPRCGKSTLLAVLALLVPRPLVASNISPAAVYRAIEAASPTLLVDEADSFFRDNEELRGVLNSGHSRDSAYVIRCVGDGMEPRQFSTWCAQGIGLIGALPATLADRSIEIRLERKRTSESVAKLTRLAREGLAMLARQSARWAVDHPIGDAAPPIPTGLNDRAADNWEPLFAIAEVAGGDWPERARAAALKLSGGERDDAQAVGVLLLADIRAIFDAQEADRLASAEVVRALVEQENRPWPEWHAGKPMSTPQLARQLHHFGIAPRTMRLGSSERLKGYLRADFRDAWARYAPSETPFPAKPPFSNRDSVTTRENTGESANFVTVTNQTCHGVENLVPPNKDGHCHAVTVSNPRSGEKDENAAAQGDLRAGEEVDL